MGQQKPYEGTRPPSWVNQNNSEFMPMGSIYKGLVKKIDSATRSGRLEVYIEGFSTNTATDPKGWRTVDYASPFMGKTAGPSYYGATNVQNDFVNTQQSYGFFMTPPDVGNIVLCCFPNGGSQPGYWFACVNPNLSKNMIPSIGGLPLDKIDPVSVPQDYVSFLRPGQTYPVSEFNENTTTPFASNWANKTLRPLHVPQFARLVRQGLDTDANGRGVISSSIQRDPISSVFGFSTPGRPLPDPANDTSLQQKLTSGEFNPAEFSVKTRIGGHSLTMDDGDIYGKSNLVKLKSASGHQIFMNDTDGFMYIANSEGTAWVELTKEGDILVYAQRDLSIRTRGNLMMHSDQHISMNSRGDVQIKSRALKVENQGTSINSEQSIRQYSKSISVGGTSGVSIYGSKASITGVGGLSITGFPTLINSGSPGQPPTPPQKINQYRLTDSVPTQASGWTATEGLLQSVNYRVPTHEPYVRGNVAQLIEQQQSIASEFLSLNETDVEGNTLNPVRSTGLTPGVDSAAALAVDPTKTAPDSIFISQPNDGRSLGKLNTSQFRAYTAQIGYTESGGKYDIENTLGYQGKYQFGAQALITLGYVKPGTPQTPDALNNPNNWTGLQGVTSADVFRRNGPIQELAMYNYTKVNYASLQNQGLIDDTTTSDKVAGLLSASHLAGTGNVYTWAKTGKDFNDGYGTQLSTYYNLGVWGQTRVPLLAESDASKQIASTSPVPNTS